MQPSKESILKLFSPIIDLLQKSSNKTVLDYIMKEILDRFAEEKSEEERNILEQHLDLEDVAPWLYELPSHQTTIPQNRHRISKYLKVWGQKVGIPFTDKMTVTGLQVEEIPVTMTANEVRDQARKRKRSMKQAEDSQTNSLDDANIGTPSNGVSVGSPKKKTKVESVSAEDNDLETGNTEVDTPAQSEGKITMSKAARKNQKRREKAKVYITNSGLEKQRIPVSVVSSPRCGSGWR
jgi:hypothetical protein